MLQALLKEGPRVNSMPQQPAKEPGGKTEIRYVRLCLRANGSVGPTRERL